MSKEGTLYRSLKVAPLAGSVDRNGQSKELRAGLVVVAPLAGSVDRNPYSNYTSIICDGAVAPLAGSVDRNSRYW